ncbi:SRPBCC family protein [Streptomyces sp. SKN60]|uniref:SRPBCC family protein n=1 Tax=Streptomyces sp. SKN60 TaxID=2855506 RepID=UPI002246705C|nr:SRPBCC family protein [Streptomyces sp. SKN60]MCX2182855.1 SRPBCC family protein [Streptomyces sp. SKN60]
MTHAARRWNLAESLRVDADRATLYGLVSDLRNMGRWSPECRGVWVRRPPVRPGTRFVGFNRRGPFLWFTTGRVTTARPGEAFAFEVGVFGLPIARWGYRFEDDGENPGGTLVTETWEDLRTGRGGGLATLLGTVFAGTNTERRIAVNRHGMRTTLERLARTATAPTADTAG